MKINRRSFLAGATAATVGAVVGASIQTRLAPPAVPACVNKAAANFFYVTRTGRDADMVHKLMGRPTNLFCTSIGSTVCGRRADTIIVDDLHSDNGRARESQARQAMINQWYQQSIIPRLTPEGTITHVRFSEPVSFDFANDCGISMWTPGKSYRNAKRMRKRPEHVTWEDRMQARADLLQRWIDHNGGRPWLK